MASAADHTDATYILYGFGNDLDWRRTCFLEPLPPSRYCAYCSCVCATMMMLPCSHIICARCHSHCTKRSSACAWDAQRFQQHDVAVVEFSREDLASKQIRCWNASQGCKISGQFLQIIDHYQKHCAHHIANCFQCNQAVLHGNIGVHLASGCSKPVTLLDVQNTQKHHKWKSLVDSIHPNAASHFSVTPYQHTKPKLGDVASSSTASVLECQYRATDIPPVLHSKHQPALLCDSRGRQSAPAHSWDHVARYLRKQVPRTAHADFLENPSSDIHGNDSLAGRKAPASVEVEITGGLGRSLEPHSGFTQVRSIHMGGTSSDSSNTSSETLLGSYQYEQTAAIPRAGTSSAPEVNSGTVLEVKMSMQNDDAYLRTERTVGTKGTGSILETVEHSLSRDKPAPIESAAPSDGKDECGSTAQAAPTVFSKHQTNSTPEPSNIDDKAVTSMAEDYVNLVCHFVSKDFDRTDRTKDELCKLKPENLVLVLKTAEEVWAKMSAEDMVFSNTHGEGREAVKDVLQCARQQNTESGDNVFSEEYVTPKVDGLISLARHVLRQRVLVSAPEQWYLENWSELKTKAIATGEAADYFHHINATFYGYAIVPGLLLENTTGTLRLHFSFYLRRGVYDEFLVWPIKKELTFSILHPTDKGKVRFLTVDTKKGQVEGCTRPENETEKPVSKAKSIKADYFDTNDYVNGDKLLLKFEVK